MNVVALGHFATTQPDAFGQFTHVEALPANLSGHDVLLTELSWLNTLDPAAREALKLRAATAAAWVALCAADAGFDERIAWQRAGVSHLLPTPLDPARLAELIAAIGDRQSGPPINVLLVGRGTCATTLRNVGMRLHAVSDPRQALTALEQEQPDLIVADIDLPGCDARELMLLVRQQPEYALLPAIFIAPPDSALPARPGCTAAETFLFEPVAPQRLIAAIEFQAQQYRLLLRSQAAYRQPPGHMLARLEQLQQAINEHAIVSVADAKGDIVFVNDKFCAISGYSRAELMGRNHRIVKSDTHPREFYRDLWRTIGSGKVWQGEVCNRRKNGELYWVEATIVPYPDARGKPRQYVSIRTDVTALKHIEAALRNSEERLRRSQIFANIGTWDLNIRSGELYWSERIAPLFGYPTGELETSYANFLAAVHPDDRQAVIDAVAASLASNRPYEIEHRVVWPDGTVRWLLERGAVTRDAHGDPEHMLGVVQDIDERKRIQIALAESEGRLREAQALVHMGNWEANLETGALHWSEEIYRIFGRDPAATDLHVDIYFLAIHPDDAAKVSDWVARAHSTGTASIEHRIVRPDGSIRHVHTMGRVERNTEGAIVRRLGTVQDITERIEAEARLRESEECFSFAVESAGDAIWDWSLASDRLKLSGGFEAIFGLAKGTIAPTLSAWMDLTHPDDRPRLDRHLADYLGGKVSAYSIELRVRCADGSYKWTLSRGKVMERDGDGKPIRMIGIASDISERKAAEENLTLFRRIVEASTQGIGITDAAGRIVYLNPAFETLTGYRLDELSGQPFQICLPQESAAQTLQDIHSAISQGKNLSAPVEARRKDGSIFVTASNFGFVSDAQGQLQNIFNVFSDFSNEIARRNELSQAKEAAERANQAKSDFLSSMSHELRTPMNAIIGFAQMLEYDAGLNADQRDNAHEILKASRHLLDLINEVLDLAKIESGRIDLSLEPVELAALVADCQQLIQPLARASGVSFSVEPACGATVRADRVRLKQALLNLMSNAVKYNREGGTIRLRAARVADGRVRIAVADSGIGIAAERMAELFQPFNRLAAEISGIEGTGIGLTITRRLVELMGGAVGAESQLGVGSTFWIDLPGENPLPGVRADDSASAAAPAGVKTDLRCVLCIDDNPANLKLIAQMLGRRRHVRLITAHTAELGVEMALAHRPDLILLDINMPGIDGYQVLEIFRADARLKAIPVLAVTANAMQREMTRGRAAGFAAYLNKPLDVQTFLATIDRYLTAAEGVAEHD